MGNLFSIFDPSGQFSIRWNWLSLVVPTLALPPIYWLSKNQIHAIFIKMQKSVHREIKAVFPNFIRPGTTFAMVSLFSFIVIVNMFSIFPFIFTPSGHLSISLALALPLWIGHIVVRAFKNPQRFFAHLVPTGTPPFLISFIVIIERIRTLIRPITLSVRLAANLVAGHLLIRLLGNMGALIFAANPALLVIVIASVMLLILELAVAVIQAYVFSLLRRLYIREVNPNSIN